MQYKILEGYSHERLSEALRELEEKVNEAIKDGWKPQGGVSVRAKNGTYVGIYQLFQAMVKEN